MDWKNENHQQTQLVVEKFDWFVRLTLFNCFSLEMFTILVYTDEYEELNPFIRYEVNKLMLDVGNYGVYIN